MRTAATAISELMTNWNTIEARVRAAYPDATEQQIHKLTAAAMNAALAK